MKRFLTLVAAVAASMILAAGAHAQFGFLVGLTSSSVKMASSDAISLYHAGLTYKIDLPSGFAIQPAVLYQVKGANVGQLGTATDEDFKVKTGFVEVPLGLQWGPHLAAFLPYVFAEPFIGYRVSSTDRGNETFRDWASQAKNNVRPVVQQPGRDVQQARGVRNGVPGESQEFRGNQVLPRHPFLSH